MTEGKTRTKEATVPLLYAQVVGLLMAVIIAALLGMMLSFRKRALWAEEQLQAELQRQEDQQTALVEQLLRMAEQPPRPATATAPDSE
ncbi:MAG: hypothetical protein ACOC95_09545 [Planctomycetota bacterium]